jgi:dTDP-4-dehydrorhamnose 3,5-epimerase
MKILDIKNLAIPSIKVITFARFLDSRGYFTEPYRKSDIRQHPQLQCLKNVDFVQSNESFSRKGTIRGLHFQWNPYMGKLVRTLRGHMMDMVLDIRKSSPSFGKIFFYEMPNDPASDTSEWIWVPPGFAHGNFFLEDTVIEYFCTGEYSQGCEAGISPLAPDLDWTLCDAHLKKKFDRIIQDGPIITDKDRNGHSLAAWQQDVRSGNFTYSNLKG